MPKKILEMQIICSGVDGIKVQLREAITLYRTRISENGLRGRIEMGLALVKTVLCQKGDTIPLKHDVTQPFNSIHYWILLLSMVDSKKYTYNLMKNRGCLATPAPPAEPPPPPPC